MPSRKKKAKAKPAVKSRKLKSRRSAKGPARVKKRW
jgi:hypothetical protein